MIFVATAEAQNAAPRPRVAVAEPLPAAAPPMTPAPVPQDPIGIALQQKLAATAKARRDGDDARRVATPTPSTLRSISKPG
jgi:hypothetical protein